MAERRSREPGLIDGLTADLGGPRTGALLDRLSAAVDWERLAAPVRELPEYTNDGPGRRPWPATMMLRCLMLAEWFNLSDPQLEESLRDRLSFRRFAGLCVDDATPDETSFVLFRRRLREAGLHESLFAGVVEQLAEAGVLVREGAMVDATIIEAPRGRGRGDGTSTRDPDASHTRKHGRGYFGYKGHIAADLGGVVVDWRLTPAREHEGHALDEMAAVNAWPAVWADAVHDSGPRRERLEAGGTRAWIAYQRRRGQGELTEEQRRHNAAVARVRARVEHAFAMLKRQFGYRRARYRGLERNALDFCLTLAAANIKRGAFLLGL